MEYPRVLVIANNSFSRNSSNGRTLGNLFIGWPKDNLAQFCISTTIPDYSICDNYYLLTDNRVLASFLRCKTANRCPIEDGCGTAGNTKVGGKAVSKTSFKALARNLIWNERWKSKELMNWVEKFNPQIVLLMNSDSTFILDIATFFSKKRGIPLVLFNTEGYYFFKQNYFEPSKWFSNTFFHLYQAIYRRHFRKMMQKVVLSIHLNSRLEEDYRKEFGGKHMVLYTGSSVHFDSANLHVDKPTFSYLGNFGYNRQDALVEIADTLQAINPSFKLDVFGKSNSPNIVKTLNNCSGIVYHGIIPYEEVVKVIYSSTILFHAESQDRRFEETLRYGFSTKIADSISSGHPFLMYSSPEIAGAKYVIETGAAWHAKSVEELKSEIVSILTDDAQRNDILRKAQKVAENNHSVNNNTVVFRKALCTVIG